MLGDLSGQCQQIVSGIAHRRDDDNYLVAFSPSPNNTLRHVHNLCGVAY
jgi:hypothetical protein